MFTYDTSNIVEKQHIVRNVKNALFRIAGNSQNIPHSFNFDIVRMKCDHQKFQRLSVFIFPC